MFLEIEVNGAASAGPRLFQGAGSTTLGRSNFPGAPTRVSRQHLEFVLQADGVVTVTPLGSNPVYLLRDGKTETLAQGVAVLISVTSTLAMDKSHQQLVRLREQQDNAAAQQTVAPPTVLDAGLPDPKVNESSQAWACLQCTFLHEGELSGLQSCTICYAPRVSSDVLDAGSSVDVRGGLPGSSSSGVSAKRARDPPAANVIELSDEEEEDGGSRAPRIVIDLDSPSPPGRRLADAAAIDLDVEDDATVAREVQRQFDIIDIDEDDVGGRQSGAAAAPIDFRSLNEARQRRLAKRQGSQASGDGDSEDLLYEQRRGLEARCAASAAKLKLRVTQLRQNEASRPGQPLYERFVAAWRQVPDKTLRIAFHATKDENMNSICASGLNPKKRGGAFGQMGGAGEYFGRDVSVSAPYAQAHSSRKMLVFAILMDRSGLRSTDLGHPGEIVIHKAAHQLPLAIVTFDRQPNAALQLGPAFGGPPTADSGESRFPGQGRTLGGRR